MAQITFCTLFLVPYEAPLDLKILPPSPSSVFFNPPSISLSFPTMTEMAWQASKQSTEPHSADLYASPEACVQSYGSIFPVGKTLGQVKQ